MMPLESYHSMLVVYTFDLLSFYITLPRAMMFYYSDCLINKADAKLRIEIVSEDMGHWCFRSGYTSLLYRGIAKENRNT